MILGNSRGAQGLIPYVFDSILSEKKYPLFNYSFTLIQSKYGPAYLNSIRRKLDPSTKDGLFILQVDPWSVSKRKVNEADNPKDYPEWHSIPELITNPNQRFNLEYLDKNYFNAWGRMILDNTISKSKATLHKNGWLEIDIYRTHESYENAINDKVILYRDGLLMEMEPSEVRLTYLYKTIEYLKTKGTVIVVRLPVHSRIYKIEQLLDPNFDIKMDSLSKIAKVPYINLLPNDSAYHFTDGNHLYKSSGVDVSEFIARKINGLE
jgi:hypothetical protein